MPADVDRSKAESFYLAESLYLRNKIEPDLDPNLHYLDTTKEKKHKSGLETRFVNLGGKGRHSLDPRRPTDPDPGLMNGLYRVMYAIHLALYRDRALMDDQGSVYERDENINYAFVGGAAVQLHRPDFVSSPGRLISTGLNIVIADDFETRRLVNQRLVEPNRLEYCDKTSTADPDGKDPDSFYISIIKLETQAMDQMARKEDKFRDPNAPNYRVFFECRLQTGEKKLYYTPLTVHWDRFDHALGEKQRSLFQLFPPSRTLRISVPAFDSNTRTTSQPLPSDYQAKKVQVLCPWSLLAHKLNAFRKRLDVNRFSLPLDPDLFNDPIFGVSKDPKLNSPAARVWNFKCQQMMNDAIDIWFLLTHIREAGDPLTKEPLKAVHLPRIPKEAIVEFHKFCDTKLRFGPIPTEDWDPLLKGRAYLWANICYDFESETFRPYRQVFNRILNADGKFRKPSIPPGFQLDGTKAKERRDNVDAANESRRNSIIGPIPARSRSSSVNFIHSLSSGQTGKPPVHEISPGGSGDDSGCILCVASDQPNLRK